MSMKFTPIITSETRTKHGTKPAQDTTNRQRSSKQDIERDWGAGVDTAAGSLGELGHPPATWLHCWLLHTLETAKIAAKNSNRRMGPLGRDYREDHLFWPAPIAAKRWSVEFLFCLFGDFSTRTVALKCRVLLHSDHCLHCTLVCVPIACYFVFCVLCVIC